MIPSATALRKQAFLSPVNLRKGSMTDRIFTIGARLLSLLVPRATLFTKACVVLAAVMIQARGLPAAESGQWRFPCAETNIARYTALRASESIRIDGKLDEPSW